MELSFLKSLNMEKDCEFGELEKYKEVAKFLYDAKINQIKILENKITTNDWIKTKYFENHKFLTELNMMKN